MSLQTWALQHCSTAAGGLSLVSWWVAQQVAVRQCAWCLAGRGAGGQFAMLEKSAVSHQDPDTGEQARRGQSVMGTGSSPSPRPDYEWS